MKRTLLLSVLLLATIAGFAQIKLQGSELLLEGPVLFKTGTPEILHESETVLASVKTFLNDKTYVSLLRVEGHVAGDNASQSLSEQRALAVTKWLVKAGVDCKRLLAVGFGDTKPVAAPDSPEKARNNRIVFAVAALRGRPVGGLPVDGGGKAAGDACQ